MTGKPLPPLPPPPPFPWKNFKQLLVKLVIYAAILALVGFVIWLENRSSTTCVPDHALGVTCDEGPGVEDRFPGM